MVKGKPLRITLALLLPFSAMIPAVARQLRPVTDPYSHTTMSLDPGDRAAISGEGRQKATVTLNFRLNSSLIEHDYMNNALMLNALDHIFSDSETRSVIDYVVITAAASPEGVTSRNETLAEDRARAIKSYIMWKNPQVNRDRLVAFSVGEDWTGLRQMVVGDRHIPGRMEVLAVLDSPLSGDQMRRKLMKIESGVAYKYMIINVFPHLRGGIACALFFKKEAPAEVIAQIQRITGVLMPSAPEPEVDSIPAGIICAGTAAPQEQEQAVDTARADTATEAGLTGEEPVPPPAYVSWSREPLLAVKTNLLFDLGSALNVEVEAPVGRRWSVAGEYIFPWWLWKSKQYCLQTLSGNVEGRYWFGDRDANHTASHAAQLALTGWFAGLYVGAGYYDFEWGAKGCQGEFYIAMGLGGGYAHTIDRSGALRMEYSLGVGYMSTKYRQYVPKFRADDWHLIRQGGGSFGYFGPTRIKVSLVWMLFHNKLHYSDE